MSAFFPMAFLDGHAAESFSPPAEVDCYRWLDKTLRQFRYTALLEKLHIEFAKSRARGSNECAACPRGAMPWSSPERLGRAQTLRPQRHAPSHHAQAVSAFLRDQLTPYLNYQQPCFFADITTDGKGRQRRRYPYPYPYPYMNTPYERLNQVPDAATFLKPGCTFAQLGTLVRTITDNQCADQLNTERQKLCQYIKNKNVA